MNAQKPCGLEQIPLLGALVSNSVNGAATRHVWHPQVQENIVHVSPSAPSLPGPVDISTPPLGVLGIGSPSALPAGPGTAAMSAWVQREADVQHDPGAAEGLK